MQVSSYLTMDYPLIFRSLLIVGLASTMIGCGGSDGPSRMPISGTVTFRGQPVTSGIVCFTPDAKRGNHGPQGIVRIVEGKFTTTDRGKGAVSGPQIVEIRGFGAATSSKGDTKPFAQGERLFPPYTVEIDIADGATTFDFDVPESAAKRTRL
jgi:hypothetical protein